MSDITVIGKLDLHSIVMYAIFGQNKYVLAFIEYTYYVTETAFTVAEERKERKEENNMR
jgi:hypothetical protein